MLSQRIFDPRLSSASCWQNGRIYRTQKRLFLLVANRAPYCAAQKTSSVVKLARTRMFAKERLKSCRLP